MYKFRVLLELAKKDKIFLFPYTLADFKIKNIDDLDYIKKYLKFDDKELKELKTKIEELEEDEFETLLAISDLNILKQKLYLILTIRKISIN